MKTTLFIKEKKSIKLFDLFFWIFLSFIFPLSSGVISLISCIKISVYICSTFFVGDIIEKKIGSFSEFPTLIISGFNIVVGSLICSLVYLFFPTDLFIYALFVLFVYCSIKFYKLDYRSFSYYELLSLLPLAILIFKGEELAYGTRELYIGKGDYFYYNAIVESLKINHNFNNAIYNQGIGINYQAFALFPAAHLAKFAQLSSPIALWGIYFKILPIVSFGLTATCITQLYKFYFDKKVNEKKLYTIQFFVICMLLFFGPLHFANLFKRDFSNTLLLGLGYLLPLGSPGFAMAIIFSILAIYFVLKISKPTLFEKIAFISFLCIVIVTKLAMFLPLFVFLGALTLLFAFRKEPEWLISMFIALPFFYLFYKSIFDGNDSIFKIEFTNNGYFFNYFNELSKKYHINGGFNFKVIVTFLVTLFLWINLKFFVLLSSLVHFRKSNPKLLFVILAMFLSILVSILPGFFLGAYGVDEYNVRIFDLRFDMQQFLRANIFLFSVISIFFLLYFTLIYKSKIVKYSFIIGMFFWMTIIFYSLVKNNFKDEGKLDLQWFKDVIAENDLVKPKLMAMVGNINYSGQYLTGMGVHPWYCTGTRIDGGNYEMTKTTFKRNQILEKLFDSTIEKSKRKDIASFLKKEGVDYIVASPDNINNINKAVKDSLIKKYENTKWFFKIY